MDSQRVVPAYGQLAHQQAKEMVAMGRSDVVGSDTQLFHPVLKRRSFHSQKFRRPSGTRKAPFCLPQNLQDMLAFGIMEGYRRSLARTAFQFREGYFED